MVSSELLPGPLLLLPDELFRDDLPSPKQERPNADTDAYSNPLSNLDELKLLLLIEIHNKNSKHHCQ